ncbi:uncharacterized protein LOC115374363 [Myripristis murdjan]|uniref:uncharacterized protein LOC115374363 n=1 Tax=Myripristis murdjan TaxID=586833 RepID=UPI001175F2B3|nr:uncharacterized protein LOC115374363 [Myripristis murdjan]
MQVVLLHICLCLLSDSVVSQLCDRRRVGLALPNASPPCEKSSRGGIRSHWDTLRRLTRQKLHRGGAVGVQGPAAGCPSVKIKEPSRFSARRDSYPSAEQLCRPPVACPYPPPCYATPMSRICCSNPMCQCRVCFTNPLWEESVHHSAPSVYSSVMIDNIIEELDSGDEETGANAPSHFQIHTPPLQQWTVSPPCLTTTYYTNMDDYFHPSMPHRFRSQSPRIRTAPPSPMRPRRVMEIPRVPPVELAKQESLDELRSTVQMAASSMEHSTKNIKLLGEKMAAATDRMSESVQDNAQALVLLAQVVERLQMLLAANRTDTDCAVPTKGTTVKQDINKQESLNDDHAPRSSKTETPKTHRQHPSLTHQSRCSIPSLSCSSSSSSFGSLGGSLDAPSTSQGTSCLSVSCHGMPRTELKTKAVPSPPRRYFHNELQATNGLFEEANAPDRNMTSSLSNQWKKKKKKMSTIT